MTVLSSEADFCVHGAQMAAGGESSPETIERAGRREEKKPNKPPEHETTGAQSQSISWNRSERLSNVSIISDKTDPLHS